MVQAHTAMWLRKIKSGEDFVKQDYAMKKNQTERSKKNIKDKEMEDGDEDEKEEGEKEEEEEGGRT